MFADSRLIAAHVVAKVLVTLNPNLLPPHLRLEAMRPLVLLCKESSASYLMQFEALLALTNILSVGTEEQDHFVHDKGIDSTYYLMFSDNIMIRRAAVEALCNMAGNKDFLQLLSDASKLKLWLGLCEEWDIDVDVDLSNDKNFDAAPHYFAARAAVGTLAMACEDLHVATSMISDEADCAKALISILNSNQPELVIRALVVLQKLTGTYGFDEENITYLMKEYKQGTRKYSTEDVKKINEILASWEKAKSLREAAVKYIVRCEVVNAFQAVAVLGTYTTLSFTICKLN